LLLASGNEGKLREFRVLAAGHALTLDLFPNFRGLPEFPESAPTFAENAAGKAIYYSLADENVRVLLEALHSIFCAPKPRKRAAPAARRYTLRSSIARTQKA